MPTTPRGLVYPSSTAAPNVPADMQALAQSIEAVWDGQPYCDVTGASQSPATSTWGNYLYSVETSDAYGMHATNSGRIVAPAAGLYVTVATVTFASSATGARIVQIRKNSAGNVASGTQVGYVEFPGFGSPSYVQVVGISPMAASDYFELFVWQSSGGALAVTAWQQVARFA